MIFLIFIHDEKKVITLITNLIGLIDFIPGRVNAIAWTPSFFNILKNILLGGTKT
jgi:hypothetical protein